MIAYFLFVFNNFFKHTDATDCKNDAIITHFYMPFRQHHLLASLWCQISGVCYMIFPQHPKLILNQMHNKTSYLYHQTIRTSNAREHKTSELLPT